MKTQKKVKLDNKFGLHSRPAMKIAETAQQFSADVYLKFNDNKVDAKSVINILMLGAGKGDALTIMADGNDSKNAVDSLRKLFESRFGEE